MLTPPTLIGRAIRLEPLDVSHVEGLAAAAAEDRASFSYSEIPQGEEEFASYVKENLALAATGRQIPFAVCLIEQDRVVGATRFMDLEVFVWPPPWPPGVNSGPAPSDDRPPTVAEIGGTWYAASVQRTGVNTEAKLLMLSHAFDTWGALRVTLKTDSRNARSRTAILRIGATFEGIRRVHAAAPDGGIRDTAYYSIIAAEWPGIRDRLSALRDSAPLA